MIRKSPEVKELLDILDFLKTTNGASYTESIPLFQKGYERWYGMLEKKRDYNNWNFSHWVLLPVHIERGYEILFEKGLFSKEQLHSCRKELILRYTKDLLQGTHDDINPDINGKDIDEICHKSRLYSKIFSFYFQDQAGTPDTPYVSEALKHIEAMAAKIELDLGGVDDHSGDLDKDVLSSVVNGYCSLIEYYPERESDMEEKSVLALKQIDELFSDIV